MNLHKELIRAYPRIALHLRTARGILGPRALDRMRRLDRRCLPGEHKFWRQFIPGFTQAWWNYEVDIARTLRNNRRRARLVQPAPLSSHAADCIAQKFWKRMGSPTFRKKIVTGVIWGPGHVADNGKIGWKRVIHARDIGVLKKIDPTTGHVGLILDCPE